MKQLPIKPDIIGICGNLTAENNLAKTGNVIANKAGYYRDKRQYKRSQQKQSEKGQVVCLCLATKPDIIGIESKKKIISIEYTQMTQQKRPVLCVT